MIMRYAGVTRLLPICSWVLLLAMLAFTWWLPPQDLFSGLLLAVIILPTTLLTVWLSAEIWCSRVSLSQHRLQIKKRWLAVHSMPWSQLERVTFNPLWVAFELYERQSNGASRRWRVSLLMTEQRALLEHFAAHLKREQYIDALNKFAASMGRQ